MSNVTLSMLDQQLFFFKCTQCKFEPKNIAVGTIAYGQATFGCPRCGFSNDLTVGPNRYLLAEARDFAHEADKQARAHGKIVKRQSEIE